MKSRIMRVRSGRVNLQQPLSKPVGIALFSPRSTGEQSDCYLNDEMFRAKPSEPSQDFDRLSFRPRSKTRDPVRTTLLIAVTIAFLALLAAMIAVLMITPPTL
jgi:hypothetical protein